MSNPDPTWMDRTFKCLQIHNIHIPGFAMATHCNTLQLFSTFRKPRHLGTSRRHRQSGNEAGSSLVQEILEPSRSRSRQVNMDQLRSSKISNLYVGNCRNMSEQTGSGTVMWKHMETYGIYLFGLVWSFSESFVGFHIAGVQLRFKCMQMPE
jgi:hypothetical protein